MTPLPRISAKKLAEKKKKEKENPKWKKRDLG